MINPMVLSSNKKNTKKYSIRDEGWYERFIIEVRPSMKYRTIIYLCLYYLCFYLVVWLLSQVQYLFIITRYAVNGNGI